LKIGAIAMLPFDPPQRDIVAVTQHERSEPSLSAIEDRIEFPPDARVGHDDQVALREQRPRTADEFDHTLAPIVVKPAHAPTSATALLTHRSRSCLYRHERRVPLRPIDWKSTQEVRWFSLPPSEPNQGQRMCVRPREANITWGGRVPCH